MFVCCECCVLSGRGLCDELITRPEEYYRLWCVVVCDLESSWMRSSWPIGGLSSQRQTNKQKTVFWMSLKIQLWHQKLVKLKTKFAFYSLINCQQIHTNYSNSHNTNYVQAILVGVSVSQSDFLTHSHNECYVCLTLSRRAAAGRSPAEIVGSNPTGGMDICLLWVSCVVR